MGSEMCIRDRFIIQSIFSSDSVNVAGPLSKTATKSLSQPILLRNKNNQRIIQEIGYCLMASGVVLVKLNSPVNDLAPGSVTRVVCGG